MMTMSERRRDFCRNFLMDCGQVSKSRRVVALKIRCGDWAAIGSRSDDLEIESWKPSSNFLRLKVCTFQ